MSDSQIDIDVSFEDATPLDLADRATELPGFDLARFATEAMLDADWDAELDRPTLEIPQKRLSALISRSIPPTCVIKADQFGAVTPVILPMQTWIS